MTLQEAIKILELYTKGVPEKNHTPFEDALYLGIEAGKYIEYLRTIAVYRTFINLPGETKE